MKDKIISVAVPRPLDSLFTYRLSEEQAAQVRVGSWVKVPFGRAQVHAFVAGEPREAETLEGSITYEELKSIVEVGPPESAIPAEVFELCRWTHDYYHSPLGEVLNAAMPASALGLRSARRGARQIRETTRARVTPHALTAMQQEAFQALESLRTSTHEQAKPPRVALLHGVTGSGKTEIYLELARRALDEGKSVLILAPEIALTPQLHQRFEESLGETVGLWHSALPDGQRRDQTAALLTGQLRVVVGARSAVFCPIQNLGLIVVDEEHDSTYKQEDRVRYHARDLAVVRGKLSGALVVLGSATPSIETLERVREAKYRCVSLSERVHSRALPQIEVLALADEVRVEGIQAVLAEKTLEAIRQTLEAGQQVMVFLNRRGFAAFLLCEECTEVSGCPNCSISLTVHKKSGQLRCHVCGHFEAIPSACSKCRSDRLLPVGAGTESLEEELPKLLPEAKILRLDRDQVTSATRLAETLERFRNYESNVLLGTQMLVKGHDFPGVTLVVVVLADALFRYPDFRAPERALQVLTQVAGRAGRGELPGRVIVQTYSPEHPVIRVLLGEEPVEAFLEGERELRQVLHYPPYARLARLRVESPHREEARSVAEKLSENLTVQASGLPAVEILGPSEAFLERAKGIYRWDLLLKSTSVKSLHQLVLAARAHGRGLQKSRILVYIDPSGIG